MRIGTSTEPADRDTAQRAVIEIYRLLDEPPPEFIWVDSPAAAAGLVRAEPDESVRGHGKLPPSGIPFRRWPFSQRLTALKFELRHRLAAQLDPRRMPWEPPPGKTKREWPVSRLPELLAKGVRHDWILEVMVREPLQETLRDNVYHPARAALLGPEGRCVDAAGYEQYDTWAAAFHDLCRTVGFVEYRDNDARHLDQWVRLARTTGWWWPGQRRCVMAERPTAVHVEPQPGALYGQLRLHRFDGPAVEYADGAEVFARSGILVRDRTKVRAAVS
ncbi:hypothetical protein GL305_02170 [Nocardia seriolae]|uniref:DUF6745 domain-containing protein n=1 Tax=Nocardia seriolae TaxID=37332 RepID=UPI0004B1CEE0|nr:hypothetical protein [Nocardia seriolae]MTJ72530.1 hypothetical protein [Nocardia seriolae]MTJ84856.1 hypothetical protein [Nocardia seriolae]MTK28852.1 hypothetical protein [Nocardia seriolae]MTK45419.1 hypothetical protein [Nocardia seriolae]MTL10464.1 hypothetical protein [Nocardia seriolae]